MTTNSKTFETAVDRFIGLDAGSKRTLRNAALTSIGPDAQPGATIVGLDFDGQPVDLGAVDKWAGVSAIEQAYRENDGQEG